MGRRRPPRVTAVALVDKPSGVTSHDVVQQLRRAFGQSQVGHTGTLDPAATGLMVVTLGRATRIARFLEATDKTYVGRIRLGRSTTTWDGEGDTVAEAKVPELRSEDVQAVLSSLIGPFEQTVPAFSAIKVGGERLHERARRGEVFEGPKRSVVVHELSLLEHDGVDVRVRARVSKGTYIRSLAMEIGLRLGVPAHLAALRRECVGIHDVAAAHPPKRFAEEAPPLISPARALAHLPARRVDARELGAVAQGRPLERGEEPAETPIRLLFGDEEDPKLAGVVRVSPARDDRLAYEVVLVRPDEIAASA